MPLVARTWKTASPLVFVRTVSPGTNVSPGAPGGKTMLKVTLRPTVEPVGPGGPNAWIFILSDSVSGVSTVTVSGLPARIESSGSRMVMVTGFDRRFPTRA